MSEEKGNKSFLIWLFNKFFPPFFRSWQGLISLAVIALFGFLTHFVDFSLFPDEFLIAFSLAPIVLLKFHYDYKRSSSRVLEQEKKIRAAETKVEQEAEFPDFLQSQLKLIAERARLVMVKAEGRANILYGVGTVLTVLSVVVPFVSIAVYINMEPLNPEILAILEKLKISTGELPSGVSVSLQRDWHILLSGISFGFLFLAAAGAIFSQHRRQTQMFLALSKDIDYFDGLAGAVEVCKRVDGTSLTEKMSTFVDRVLEELIKRPGIAKTEEQIPEGYQNMVKTVYEYVLKQVK